MNTADAAVMSSGTNVSKLVIEDVIVCHIRKSYQFYFHYSRMNLRANSNSKINSREIKLMTITFVLLSHSQINNLEINISFFYYLAYK